MVLKDGKKMSKSLGNVISPSEIIDEYGADTCRLFILSAAPPEQDIDWKDSEVKGSYLFLQDLYDLVSTSTGIVKKETAKTKEFRRIIHQTIKKVTEAIEKRKFNIVQSFIRILLNKAEELDIDKHHEVFSEAMETIILLLSPFVPHLTEELWSMKGYKTSVHEESWITWDEQLLVEEEIELPIQVNGKIRGKIKVSQKENEDVVKEKALAAVEHITENQQIKQIRVIPKKIISIVI
jgi:leucyl-tRNA synthetase